MKVKSKVNTKKLVKGSIYDVVELRASTNAKYYNRNRVLVKMNSDSNQWFTIHNFTLENGDNIPKIDWKSDDFKMNNINPWELRINENNLQVGDYVVYVRNSHSTLIHNRKYKVVDINKRTFTSQFGHHSYVDIDIKLEGSTRYYKSTSFRICTAEETRDINLKLVFDEETDLQKVDKNKRNFDFFSDEEKELILIRTIFKSALDKNRNNLSLIDWAATRVEPTLKLKKEDFEELLKKDLKSIIEKL